jgi:hypothetical protein
MQIVYRCTPANIGKGAKKCGLRYLFLISEETRCVHYRDKLVNAVRELRAVYSGNNKKPLMLK